MALPRPADLAMIAEVMGPLRRLADACTYAGCEHEHHDEDGKLTSDPAYCHCRSNLMTPGEFLDWIEDERRFAQRSGKNEPAGRPNGKSHPNLQLAVA
jgi:hypothetical protein